MSPSSDAVPQLQAGHWLLRPWRETDADAVLELSRDQEAWRWMPSLRRVAATGSAVDWLAQRREPGRHDWAATDPGSGQVVGRVGLHHHRPEDRRAEIGYVVWPQWRGRGVATDLVRAAARFGFAGLGLHRIALYHAVGNVVSCRVAARCGFAYEGVERQALDHGDGVWHDEHRHARLATDPEGPVVPGPPPPRPIEPVEIAAGRLQLRPPAPGEAEDTLALLRDPEVLQWNPVRGAVDLAVARAWIMHSADWSGGDHATFSALDAVSGRLLGHVSVHAIDRTHRSARIGYRVAPWARGQGVATDTLRAVTRWALGTLDLARIELAHAVENAPSCRVAEKAGYALEGTMRASYVYGDGRHHDEHLHAVTGPA